MSPLALLPHIYICGSHLLVRIPCLEVKGSFVSSLNFKGTLVQRRKWIQINPKFSIYYSLFFATLFNFIFLWFSTMHLDLTPLFYSNYCVYTPSVQFSRSVVSDSLRPHEPQHNRPPCPSPTPGVHSNSHPSSQWCHPAISSSIVPFSSCPQSLPASESFPMSQLFACGGQSIGVSASASVLPVNTQDWSPLGWTGWISLQSKGLARVFSNTTVQKKKEVSQKLKIEVLYNPATPLLSISPNKMK